jgi:hypothetical protein
MLRKTVKTITTLYHTNSILRFHSPPRSILNRLYSPFLSFAKWPLCVYSGFRGADDWGRSAGYNCNLFLSERVIFDPTVHTRVPQPICYCRSLPTTSVNLTFSWHVDSWYRIAIYVAWRPKYIVENRRSVTFIFALGARDTFSYCGSQQWKLLDPS